jgi:hypothetical protein
METFMEQIGQSALARDWDQGTTVKTHHGGENLTEHMNTPQDCSHRGIDSPESMVNGQGDGINNQKDQEAVLPSLQNVTTQAPRSILKKPQATSKDGKPAPEKHISFDLPDKDAKPKASPVKTPTNPIAPRQTRSKTQRLIEATNIMTRRRKQESDTKKRKSQ